MSSTFQLPTCFCLKRGHKRRSCEKKNEEKKLEIDKKMYIPVKNSASLWLYSQASNLVGLCSPPHPSSPASTHLICAYYPGNLNIGSKIFIISSSFINIRNLLRGFIFPWLNNSKCNAYNFKLSEWIRQVASTLLDGLLGDGFKTQPAVPFGCHCSEE